MGGDAYDVFVSYSRSDEDGATELNGWLCSQGLSTFFDRSKLRPGLRWVPALEDAIGRSRAVAVLVGKHGIGNTQQYERELALVRQTQETTLPVIPVLMPGCVSPPTGFLQLLTWVDLSKGASVLQQTESLAALRAALHGEAIAPSELRASICPYRGLEPFREEDAPFFCGRDAAISELAAQVEVNSFVAVVRLAAASRRWSSRACCRRCARSARRELGKLSRSDQARGHYARLRPPSEVCPRTPVRPRSTLTWKRKLGSIATVTRTNLPAWSMTASTLRQRNRIGC